MTAPLGCSEGIKVEKENKRYSVIAFLVGVLVAFVIVASKG